MGWFGKSRENISERIDLEKSFIRAVNEANNLLEIYQELLKPLLGSEEFAKRLVNLIIYGLGKENIELNKSTINRLYQDILEHLNSSSGFLEKGFAGALVSDNDIIEMIIYHIERLEKMIEIEIKYPQEIRLVSKKELEAIVKILENVMKEFDRNTEINNNTRRKALEEIAYPKGFGQHVTAKISGWLTPLNKSAALKALEQMGNEHKKFKNDVKKRLNEIREFIEKNY